MDEQVKQSIQEYISVDDKISLINKDLKELRSVKKGLEEDIKNFMINNNVTKLDVNNEQFVIKETVKTKSLNKKTIATELLTVLDHNQVDTITKHLFSKDEETPVQNLERKTKKI